MMQNIDSSSQHDVQQPGVETLRENGMILIGLATSTHDVIENMENFFVANNNGVEIAMTQP